MILVQLFLLLLLVSLPLLLCCCIHSFNLIVSNNVMSTNNFVFELLFNLLTFRFE